LLFLCGDLRPTSGSPPPGDTYVVKDDVLHIYSAIQPAVPKAISQHGEGDPEGFIYGNVIVGRPVPHLEGKEIRCGIVTHHLLASRLIVGYFRGVAQTGRPKRIVLIGPDHAGKGLGAISVSSLSWQTPFGILEADTEAISRLGEKLRLLPDPEAFSNEHSIGVLVPFVKHFFPDARLVPILVKTGAGRETLNALCRALEDMNNGETHFLLSSDFSHGKRPAEASRHDLESARVIVEQAFGSVWSLDDDCRAGLYVLLKLSIGAVPLISAHTNSAEIVGKNLDNCTSYFTVFFATNPRAQ
jgi:hypothetical protein